MRVLITGGTGSLGRALAKRLISNGCEVVVYSRDEGKHFLYYAGTNVICDIGDVRDKDRLVFVLKKRKPNLVIHAAALKRIDDLEFSPDECFQTNVMGTQNVISAVATCDSITKCLLVSTDKAVSPINCYGASKLMAERIFSNAARDNTDVRFASVRYGNVIASRGSFIPLWISLAQAKKKITVTSLECTRFLFTLNNAVDAVLRAADSATLGEVYVPIMLSFSMQTIIDAVKIITGHCLEHELIGMRPGEKLHEQIINELETPRTRALNGMYAIVPEGLAAAPHLDGESFLLRSLPAGLIDQMSSNSHICESLNACEALVRGGIECAADDLKST